ncbi:MAG: AraC family transcriptional regulator [Marinobacter sp.]|nr:AraC family transcriptional regulator [Marinobacter sp.]
MRNPDTRSELEAYLRLNRATSGEWLHALRQLLGCGKMACNVQRPQAMLGSLSALESDAGVICVLNVAQEMELGHCQLASLLLAMPIEGRCEITLAEGTRLPVVPLAMVPAEKNFTLTVGAGSQLVLAFPVNRELPRWPEPACAAALADNLSQFLFHSEYFQSHQHACIQASHLFATLEQVLLHGPPPHSESQGMPELDRRLIRVIDKIRCEPEWAFNLQELASHSGVSERNLYYLMKRETGMTPYRFYQRCRLIRVRRRLVDCQCDIPHISWYAADEGFSHLGRFAALYREHFGELPSETVQWRRRLQALDETEGSQASIAV